jgi:DNA-binding transcriptional MerR regulator
MFITDIVDRLTQEGFKITPRTIKFYIERGLLPEPMKRGGYQEGVRLAYKAEDSEKIMEILYLIFSLKGRGYKLADIKSEVNKLTVKKQAEALSRYIEIDGFFREEIQFEPHSRDQETDLFRYPYHAYADSVGELLTEALLKGEELHKWGPLGDIKMLFSKIEGMGLWITPYCFKGRLVYDTQWLFQVARFVDLHKAYVLPWETIQTLFRKHEENERIFLHWPECDGVRFNQAWVEFHLRRELNDFGDMLLRFLEWIYMGCPFTATETGFVCWDSVYNDTNEFLDDFLAGRCAWVPSPFQDPRKFLKRFEVGVSHGI